MNTTTKQIDLLSNDCRERFAPKLLASRILVNWLLFSACLLSLLCYDKHLFAQGPDATSISKEYKLRIAYLYNFSRYFEWPDEAFTAPEDPFVIGVLGNDPFGTAIDRLQKKKFNKSRTIVVRRFDSWDQCVGCHMLYVSTTASNAASEEAIQAVQGKPLLIVSEVNSQEKFGALVQFYPDANGTIGFELDIDAVRERNLGVDAKLLKLAKIVRGSASQVYKQ